MKFKRVIRFLCVLVCLFLSNDITAQVTQQNISTVKVDEMSDDQIRAFMRQFEATGLPESQLEQAALAKGVAPSEIQKLKQRIVAIKSQGTGKGSTEAKGVQSPDRIINSSANSKDSNNTSADSIKLASPPSRVFGSELFRNTNISFEPNLRIATPQNYVIGPDDEIIIDITGDNEANYRLKVSPEGSIRVEYAGIIPVSGITVEQATSRIRTRLQQTYPGMRSGRTRLAVSIGNIRSIKVTLLGEVVVPGTYTISSLSTVFNALYYSGGPNKNGSFRQIEVIRNNRIVATLDVYDYLLKGFQTKNIRLQDQDLIRIPTYKKHVDLSGEIKHPAIFELLSNETLQDVLNFAGGFTDAAYTARVKITQNTATEKKIADISTSEFALYKPGNGDVIVVDKILNRFANRVSIQGAVFRPGQFELKPGLTLSQLIKNADGVTEDAFLSRGSITRLRPDNTTENISFDLAKILAGTVQDIALMREDIVSIASIFDLRGEYKVSIDGEIRQPGTFNYAENMSLEDLIVLAGGFEEGASPKRIEISRRVKNSDANSVSAKTATVFQVNVDQNLRLLGERFILQPFDIVTVRNEIGYEVQRKITIEGEVLYPGSYVLTRKDEKVSDAIQRAGGLTALASPAGASLKRPASPSGSDKNKINNADEEQQKLMKFQRLQATAKDSLDISTQQTILQNVYVGINLEKILEKPGSKFDLVLEEGDILRVPKQLQTVKVSGEILFPVTTIYNSGKGFKEYISDAGGFSDRSLKRRAYVLYANGSVKSTKKFLFFNNYPVVRPGAEIFVPQKAEKNKLSAQELGWNSIGSSFNWRNYFGYIEFE